MSAPSWLGDLLAASDVLAARDRAAVAAWGDDDSGSDGPPLTMRLAALGTEFARRIDDITPAQQRAVLSVLERVLESDTQHERDAVATGFLEALISAWDEGFDLARLWPDLGPKSRSYAIAWNSFNGVESPAWMTVDEPRAGEK